MNIMFRVEGNTINIVVDEKTITLGELKTALCNRLRPRNVTVDQLRLRYNGHLLEEDGFEEFRKSLEGQSHASVECAIIAATPPDPDVVRELHADLDAILVRTQQRLVVFIGLASSNASNSKGGIERQQCPDTIRQYCSTEKYALRILLVDPAWGDHENKEIYTLEDTIWRHDGERTQGKVVDYVGKNNEGWKLTTYKTLMNEYDLVRSLNNRLAITGWKLEQISLAWTQHTNQDFCVISGNFYAENTDKSQYITIGSPTLVGLCGFTWNP